MVMATAETPKNTTPSKNNEFTSPFERILPKTVRVGKDKLQFRLDFYTEAIVMQTFQEKGGSFRLVSPLDVAKTLANEMPFSSGLLPPNTLWWRNSRSGPEVAIWVEPGIKRLALQRGVGTPERYNVPLPGLIFICQPGRPPSVYAATHRPDGIKDQVFKAPLANVYNDGRTCPGNHRFSNEAGKIPDDFFRSFFTPYADIGGRSKKHPNDITLMWKDLDREKKEKYPLDDLVYHGTVGD